MNYWLVSDAVVVEVKKYVTSLIITLVHIFSPIRLVKMYVYVSTLNSRMYCFEGFPLNQKIEKLIRMLFYSTIS
jgi:hypothetical protein